MVHSIVAVDIGNSFIKLAVLTNAPTPLNIQDAQVVTFKVEDVGNSQWQALLESCPFETQWFLASVNQSSLDCVVQWLDRQTIPKKRTILNHQHVPLDLSAVDVQQVGVDRILSALGARDALANPLPVVVVDIGTAVTIDAVTAEGAFLGGVIMPGLHISARALSDYTDQLPQIEIDISDLQGLPQAIGTCTQDAIKGGLVWGLIGGIEAVVKKQQQKIGNSAHLFIAGVDYEIMLNLPFDTTYIPNLCLRGVIHVAQTLSDSD
jgi:type III pantothenate kinase